MFSNEQQCFQDNFFFQAERAKILAEKPIEQQSDETNKTSFEDIGRIIGQRWRVIETQELEKYKKLAKEDNERYRDQMKDFYKDELTLMCQGYSDGVADIGTVDTGDDGRKRKSAKSSSVVDGTMQGNPPLFENSRTMGAAGETTATCPPMHDNQKHQTVVPQSKQNPGQMGLMSPLMSMSSANNQQGQQEQQVNDRYKTAVATNSPFTDFLNSTTPSFQPAFGEAGAQASKPAPNSMFSLGQASMATLDDDQILQSLLQYQQSCINSPGARIPNDTVVMLILNQKASLQQRERKLAEEIKGLQLRSALLDKMLAHEVNVPPPPDVEPQRGGGEGMGQANSDVARMHATAVAAGYPNTNPLVQTLPNANAYTMNQLPADIVAQQQQQQQEQKQQLEQQQMNLANLFGSIAYQNNYIPAVAPLTAPNSLLPWTNGLQGSQSGNTDQSQQGYANSMDEDPTNHIMDNSKKSR